MLNVYMEHPVETKLNSDLLTYHYHNYYIIANNVGHFVGLLRSGGGAFAGIKGQSKYWFSTNNAIKKSWLKENLNKLNKTPTPLMPAPL